MTEHKFTDEEIIKAVEFCVSNKDTCEGCPCVEGKFECVTNDPKFSLDLINRQKAEVAYWMDAAANARKEAVKEFVELLEDFQEVVTTLNDGETITAVNTTTIHKVAKKMIGETEK